MFTLARNIKIQLKYVKRTILVKSLTEVRAKMHEVRQSELEK